MCGLFLPGDAEYPGIKKDTSDPLKFKTILTGSTEKFQFQSYEELFGTNFKYINAIAPGDNWDRSQFLNRLRTISNIALDEKMTVSITWNRLNPGEDEKIEQGVANTLKPRIYSISITSGRGRTFQRAVFTGEAIFTIAWNEKHEWCITQWIDKNTTAATAKSYFHPEFTPLRRVENGAP